MKKELLIAAALVLATGTITAEDTTKKASTENAKSEFFDINGDFSKAKYNLPDSWCHNKTKNLPGTAEMIKTKDGNNIVKLSGTEKGPAHLYYSKGIAAKDGDKIEITMKAKGSGKGGTCIYIRPNGGRFESFQLGDEWKEYKVVLPVKGYKCQAESVRIVLLACPKSEVMFSEVKARKLKSGKDDI